MFKIILRSFGTVVIFGLIMLVFHNGQLAQGEASEIIRKIDDRAVPIEVFVRDKCSKCHREKTFLQELSNIRSDIRVRLLDIDDATNYNLWLKLTKLENLSKNTPITLVGNTIVQGFDVAKTTGERIIELVDQSKGQKTYTITDFIMAGGSGKVETVANGTCPEDGVCPIPEAKPYNIKIPFLGVVNIKEYSLPILSVILGFVDGFNPCAMWVLVTFIVVLMQIGNKKRMWQIAGLFIVAEAVMYYLILNVWLTTWNFVQLDNIMTPIVGLIAIGGGIFFMYEWYSSDGTCKVTNVKQRTKISKKIHYLAESEMTILTILGVIGLALTVNVIEFACSIGIPQTFTKILDMNNLGVLTKQFYMLLYIIFYMADDLLVFGIALYSIEKIGITTKYAKICNLIGGLLMIFLGIVLLFQPSLLVMG